MSKLSALTSKQLKRAAAIKKQIKALEQELSKLNKGKLVVVPGKRGRKRGAKVKAATIKTQTKTAMPNRNRKRTRAAKARMSEAAKARWAKVRAEKSAV